MQRSISASVIVSTVDALPSAKLIGCERTILAGAADVKFVQAGEDESLCADVSPDETKDVQNPIVSSDKNSSVYMMHMGSVTCMF